MVPSATQAIHDGGWVHSDEQAKVPAQNLAIDKSLIQGLADNIRRPGAWQFQNCDIVAPLLALSQNLKIKIYSDAQRIPVEVGTNEHKDNLARVVLFNQHYEALIGRPGPGSFFDALAHQVHRVRQDTTKSFQEVRQALVSIAVDKLPQYADAIDKGGEKVNEALMREIRNILGSLPENMLYSHTKISITGMNRLKDDNVDRNTIQLFRDGNDFYSRVNDKITVGDCLFESVYASLGKRVDIKEVRKDVAKFVEDNPEIVQPCVTGTDNRPITPKKSDPTKKVIKKRRPDKDFFSSGAGINLSSSKWSVPGKAPKTHSYATPSAPATTPSPAFTPRTDPYSPPSYAPSQPWGLRPSSSPMWAGAAPEPWITPPQYTQNNNPMGWGYGYSAQTPQSCVLMTLAALGGLQLVHAAAVAIRYLTFGLSPIAYSWY